MKRQGCWILAMILLLASSSSLRAEELMERLERLYREGHHDLALALLEDHLDRGTPMGPELKWMQARLLSDPDMFDRNCAELVGGKSPADSMVQSIVLARSRELFARGQYLSALEKLRSLPPEADVRFSQIPFFRAMAGLAVGEIRNVRRDLQSIPQESSYYPDARHLLAELSLRQGDPTVALRYCDDALQAGKENALRPQLLYTRALALEQLDRDDEARDLRSELIRSYPHSCEAGWLLENLDSQELATFPGEMKIREEEIPLRRQSFALQFGAFRDRFLALKMASALDGKIDKLRIERDNISSPPLYRVVGGEFATRSVAERRMNELAREGQAAMILSPGRNSP